jgi:outer membrane protein assembly factor BamE (lipoprotein component of BamABCDE complex)
LYFPPADAGADPAGRPRRDAGFFFRPIDRDAGAELVAKGGDASYDDPTHSVAAKTGKFGVASEDIMTKRFLRITGVVLCCVAAAYYASNKPDFGQTLGATPDASGYNQDYSDATLAEVIPGKTTKAQVEALLGQPWRTTNLAKGHDEPGHEAPEVWEWRGQDSQNGLYRVHIEFNQQGIVTNIAKIPEKTGMAPARVAPEKALKPQPPTQAVAPSATPQVTDNPSAGMFRHQMPAQPTLNGGD